MSNEKRESTNGDSKFELHKLVGGEMVGDPKDKETKWPPEGSVTYALSKDDPLLKEGPHVSIDLVPDIDREQEEEK